MLAGLLLYDVFWVFGSKSIIGDNVMLTVATSNIISGPTRLLFPRLEGKPMGEAADFPFSLLGEPLIDIVVIVVNMTWMWMKSLSKCWCFTKCRIGPKLLQHQKHDAGLGDIAVPGLLACLALRFDASRATNMRARADAAAEALKGAFAKLEVSLLILS